MEGNASETGFSPSVPCRHPCLGQPIYFVEMAFREVYCKWKPNNWPVGWGMTVTTERDDRELMRQAAQNGDAGALAELVRRWDRRVLGFLTKAVADPDAAKDLRQEVFLRVHRSRATYDPRYAFTTWLFRIVRNVLATWRVREVRNPSAETVCEELLDPSLGPAEQAVQAERGRQVRAAIAELTPGERELLLQRFDLEMSYREMAEIHGVPETTLKSRTYVLLERLRRALDRVAVPERSPDS